MALASHLKLLVFQQILKMTLIKVDHLAWVLVVLKDFRKIVFFVVFSSNDPQQKKDSHGQ